MADPGLELRGRRVVIRTTSEEDLPALMALWNDGEVMHWVGFPEGLGYDEARTARWLAWIRSSPDRHHFCVYAEEIGFCGETYCGVDREHRRGALDIKFTPPARGGGRSLDALMTHIDWCFRTLPEIDVVFTEPSPENLAARTLYYSCGLRPAERPADLEPYPSYWELRREEWAAAERHGSISK